MAKRRQALAADLVAALDLALSRVSADADVEYQRSAALISLSSDEHGDQCVVCARSIRRATFLAFRHERTFRRDELAPADDTPDLWRRVECVNESTPGADAALWALPSEVVWATRNCFDPGPANVAVFTTCTCCVLLVTRDLKVGEELVRQAAVGLSRTISRAAAVLGVLSRNRWASTNEYESLFCAVEAAISAPFAMPTPRFSAPATSLPETLAVPSLPVRIYTDYALIAEQLVCDARFEVVNEPRELDLLWTTRPLTDFQQLPAGLLVNQFPFEGCLVQKDLLGPLTSRLSTSTSGNFPPWMPPTYDLATQSHLWRAKYQAGTTTWIVKRATGTHSNDCCVSSVLECVLQYALADDCDRVAQEYIAHPALLPWGDQRRKFDMRVYVAVRRFWPCLEAVMDSRLYGRVAGAAYSAHPDTHGEFDVHFTVSWYNNMSGAEASVSQPLLLPSAELQRLMTSAGGKWPDIQATLIAALRELFSTAGRCFIGSAPDSRALYGVDVMFTESWQPQILEVNFSGDLATLVQRLPGGSRGFVGDTIAYLCFGDMSEHHVAL